MKIITAPTRFLAQHLVTQGLVSEADFSIRRITDGDTTDCILGLNDLLRHSNPEVRQHATNCAAGLMMEMAQTLHVFSKRLA